MADISCRTFLAALNEAAAEPLAADIAAHADVCPDCAREAARQSTLVRRLSARRPTPRIDLRPPALPPAPGGRLLTADVRRWAAVAAAGLFALVAWRVVERGVDRVRVERVVDVAGAPPQTDERLLALTGGVEAVAMRRPTEMR